MFLDRTEAGRLLAQQLLGFKDQHPVVLALPRGGVPVGFEIARALGAPLDLVLVRKIGAPYQEELAIGAIADGEHPELVTDPGLIDGLDVTAEYLERAKATALQEIERRRHAWLGDRRRSMSPDAWQSLSMTASLLVRRCESRCALRGGESRRGWCSRCQSRHRTPSKSCGTKLMRQSAWRRQPISLRSARSINDFRNCGMKR